VIVQERQAAPLVAGQDLPEPLALDAALRLSASSHRCLCPRQVLGARIGLYGGALLGLRLPRTDRRLLAIVETDGCAVDGVSAATGCAVGKRTLRIEDYGKVAATFVDCETGRAVRVAPSAGSRTLAREYAPDSESRWHGQLRAYQVIPSGLLLEWRSVALRQPVRELMSAPGLRAICDSCGEEIMNQREVIRPGAVLCRACASGAYYEDLPSPPDPLSTEWRGGTAARPGG
jgi:formylmethanofuran dehydrogenase subunit E